MIEKFAPFGMDNPRPLFLFSNIKINNIRKFGNGGIHLQIDFEKSNGEKISAIGFFMADKKNFNFNSGQRIDLIASLEKSTFRGSPELRLRIVDISKNY
jgi:single-stranded-DNA-specific exonuclease